MSGIQTSYLTVVNEEDKRMTLPVPTATLTILLILLNAFAEEKPVTLLPLQALLSLKQVSELLHTSPEFVRDLLGTGELPFSEGAFGPQIRYAELLAYQERRALEREQVLRELIEETERLGLYDR